MNFTYADLDTAQRVLWELRKADKISEDTYDDASGALGLVEMEGEHADADGERAGSGI